ncbi:PREDICTED: vacuolar protein-sorting protein BRO1 [Camelina sativa]|uniref:Vacuolar protein-sorting protein BRO1 n=1 Tax=Camelina sativa TaxID=90675 RepID=A0ABM0UY26_CAMSA|nr:PREDICTED: vacuolar protein-sorting protein BRO1 [Camelina sativa]
MASGSSGRVNSGSKGFDFGSDDILCSDYTNQDSSNGPHSDPSIAASNMEFHKTRMARSSIFPTSSYSPPEDSLSQDLTDTVERTMKKYADNMMRFLEGISSRLSQLELYCYNLDKTIGEMRSELTHEHEEADVKLRSLDKHLQEVHRSVQILRDKQELADTQKELAKLQLVQKESSSSSHSQHGEDRVATPVPEPKKSENTSDPHNQQLALALPHQIAPQPPGQQPQPQQQQQYYMPPPPPQLQNTPAPAPVPIPPSQPQAPPAQSQYMPPPPAPSHPSSAQTQSFPQYQQNWPPQPQARPPPSSGTYQTYPPAPPSNQSPVESLPSSMQMQSPYSGPPQQSMQAYGYGAPPPPQAPQQTKMSYSPQTGDGYLQSGPPPPSAGYANAMYEGGRMQYTPPQPQQQQQQQTHYLQGPQGGGYAPQPHQAGGGNTGAPPVMRSKYGELIEKLVSMGFRGDHVMAVIQRMEESGQPIDFNALLDRLSGQSSGGPPRGGW